MFEANIIFRQRCLPAVVRIMEEWWKFLEQYSRRDQLNLTYVLWRNGVVPVLFFEDTGISVREYDGYEYMRHVEDKACRKPLALKLALSMAPVRSWRRKVASGRALWQ